MAIDNHLTARQLLQLPLRTRASTRRADLAATPIPLVNTLVLLAHLLRRSARSTDGGCVTEVGVDADEIGGKPKGANVLDDDFTGRLFAVVGAVAAGAVELSCVDDGVVFDGYRAGATEGGGCVSTCLGVVFGSLWVGKGEGEGRLEDVLVLNNFVAGLSGASALDEGISATKNGDGVFADVAEPDVC